MNPDEILDILVAHGVPGTVIVRVAKLLADSQLTESRRTKNRERMQSVRTRARNGAHTETQKTTNIEERKKEEEGSKFIPRFARTKKPKTPLPANWHPELAGDIEFEKFSDHARQNDRRCADWEAAWRNWNRNKPQFNKGGQNGHGRRHGSVLDAFDRLGEKLKTAGATDDYVPGSEGPRPLELDQKVRPAGLKLIPKR